MSNIVENFNKIKLNIEKTKPLKPVNIVAVSKTFSLDHIKPLIDSGHSHFGENKVQEAVSKWSLIKNEKKNINLHMIGRLQSNKAKKSAEIFNYIHSLDNQKLADILSKCENDNNKRLKYFIQVNVGNELQKSGIPFSEVDAFYNYCVKEINLNVIGLMIIPPSEKNSKQYFKVLNELNSSLGLKDLSMGMSADFEDAIKYNSTFVRIGSLIFGSRA